MATKTKKSTSLSRFTGGRRQIMQTQGTAQATFEAATDDELRAKIGLVAASGKPATIVTTGPISPRAPYVLPPECAGLTIRSTGRFALTPIGALATLFEVRAANVCFDGLSVGLGAEVTDVVECFVRMGADVSSLLFEEPAPTIQNCVIDAGQLYEDTYENDSPMLIGVRFRGRGSGAFSSIKSNGSYGCVIGCQINPLGTHCVELVGNASGWMISANPLFGAVDTSASAGRHRLAGNGGVFTHNIGYLDYDADVGDRFWIGAFANDTDYAVGFVSESSVIYETLTATRTVTIPAAADWGERAFYVKDQSGNASSTVKIIVTPASGTIDGAASKEITSAYGSIELYSDSVNWYTRVPTGSSGGTGWTTVTKTATETRASTAALANDATLKFPMLANTTYRFRMTVFFSTDINADFRYGLTGPAAPTKVDALCTHGAVGVAPANQVVDTSYANTASGAIDGSSGDGCVKIEGIIQNGANAGDMAFQWAQGTSNLNNTSVLKGSYIEHAVVA